MNRKLILRKQALTLWTSHVQEPWNETQKRWNFHPLLHAILFKGTIRTSVMLNKKSCINNTVRKHCKIMHAIFTKQKRDYSAASPSRKLAEWWWSRTKSATRAYGYKNTLREEAIREGKPGQELLSKAKYLKYLCFLWGKIVNFLLEAISITEDASEPHSSRGQK